MKIISTTKAIKTPGNAGVYKAARFYGIFVVLQLFVFLFPAGQSQAQSCEKSSSCFTFYFNGATNLLGGKVLLSFTVKTNCNKSLSNVAFSLPAGATALQPVSHYAALYNYSVENTTINPFYAIKFEANNAENFKNGKEDVFEYVLSAADFAGSPAVRVRAKAGNLIGEAEFVFGECQVTPLPVELVSFSAASTPQNVVLTWATASETDNEGFAIERSLNGKHFEELDFLPGNGTTNKPCSYTFTDRSPANGTAYYRLKQTDFNGIHKYSPTRAVTFAASSGMQQLRAYPNPAGSSATLQLPEGTPQHAVITIASATGQVVYLETAQNMAAAGYRINASHLQPGVYFITLQRAQNTSPFRLIKL